MSELGPNGASATTGTATKTAQVAAPDGVAQAVGRTSVLSPRLSVL